MATCRASMPPCAPWRNSPRASAMRGCAPRSADRDEHGRSAALHFYDERGQSGAALAQLLQVIDPGLIDGDDDIVAADAGRGGGAAAVDIAHHDANTAGGFRQRRAFEGWIDFSG